MSTRGHIPPAASLPARVLAAAVALAFCLGPLGSILHEVEVRHDHCDEHGEIVHTPILEGDDPGGAVAVARDGESVPASDEHDHCYLCPSAREQLALNAPSAAAAPTPIAYLLQPASVADESAARALYRLAPKTSPPAA